MTTNKIDKKPLLRLAEINCTLFEVTIEVSEKGFRTDDFLRALPFEAAAKHFREYGTFYSVCNRRTSRIDYRAEVRIHKLIKKKDLAIHIVLTRTKRRAARNEVPPSAEEILPWLRQFISKDASVTLAQRGDFVFPAGKYHSVFSLPMVIAGSLNRTGHPVFENSLIVGSRIVFSPNQLGLSSVTHEIANRTIAVSLRRRITTDSAKLLTVERDVGVLYNIGVSTVRAKGKPR